MARAAILEGCALLIVDDPMMYGGLAALLRRAESLQSADSAFLAERELWTTYTDGVRRDGAPPEELPATLDLPGIPLPRGATPEVQQPMVGVLLTAQDEPRDHVLAGQALQRVLLATTAWGLSASFLSPVIQVPQARVVLRTMLNVSGHPQALLRFGYGYPAPVTARRPAAEVTRYRVDV